MEERLEVLLKQKEMVTEKKDLAEKLQHHFDVSQIRYEPRLGERARAKCSPVSVICII